MLEKLLARISQKGAASLAELARELDTSPALVESMLAELESRGYLERVESCATGHCTGCSVKNSCHRARMWTVGRPMKCSLSTKG
jgi:predicted ArsR family transcriptional regulator